MQAALPKVAQNPAPAYDYYLVLDFEAQCIENAQITPQEIIEFPVVVVDAKALQIMTGTEFHHYVRPTVHKKLTDFCQQLTKIQQEQVDVALTLPEVLEKLEQFLKQSGILESKFVFVTCGDWDLRTCLPNECREKGIKVPEYLARYVNVKSVYRDFYGTKKQYGMAGMLKYLGLPLVGQHHSGIDDARNIAALLVTLLQKGACVDEKKHVNSVWRR